MRVLGHPWSVGVALRLTGFHLTLEHIVNRIKARKLLSVEHGSKLLYVFLANGKGSLLQLELLL